ncbi:hypothetical protein [Curtobacterium herbarum]|uniref:hypothetical protein n=1 Tax=Curtobacterium herbarum TaxID=150122 RepID=UPI001C8CF504|nr:hypothetical protein [Curtobacterium herbarum]MBY0176679.1 hypothetical protein [Curtobacterium herbarum]
MLVVTPNRPSSVTHCRSASRSPSTSIVEAVLAEAGTPPSDAGQGFDASAGVGVEALEAAGGRDVGSAAFGGSPVPLHPVSKTSDIAVATNALVRRTVLPVELI